MKPDYPAATWVPAFAGLPHIPGNFRIANRQPADIRRIVIHCTDGREHAMPVAKMWQMPGHLSSAHFVVGQDGEIIQCVELRDIAYHAHSANRLSVGIEHCARTPGELWHGDPGLAPSPVQLAASAKLSAWLCKIMSQPPTREIIRGHAEIDPATSHDRCPTGCGLNLDDYVAMVAAVYEGA